MSITGHYLEIDRRRVFVDTAGEGLPLVLLHSAGRDSRIWHGVMEQLAALGPAAGIPVRTIAPDLPGHGRSAPLPGPACLESPEAASELVDAVLSRLEIPASVVVGCSLGGSLALHYAATRRDRCLAAIVFEAGDYTPTFSTDALDLIDHPHVSPAYYLLPQVLSLLGSAADEPARELNRWYAHQLSGRVLQSDLRMFSDFDLRARTGQITCPVLMARGEEDWIVPEDKIQDTVARLTGSRLVQSRTLPTLGHFPPLEDPETVASLILEFLAASELTHPDS